MSTQSYKASRPAPAVEVVEVKSPTLAHKRGKLKKHGLDLTGVGATIGNMIAPGIGGVLGHAAEKLFGTILGFGDYKEEPSINKPLPMNNTVMGLQTSPVREQVENMHWNGLATRIAHREFIGNISMSSGFAAAAYNIDPTSKFMFPWLANGISSSFQKWKLLGCVFEYVPTSVNAIAASTPAVGSVALAVQYDQLAFTPTSMTNLLNTQGAVSARPQDTLVCAVECDPGMTPMNPLFIAEVGINIIDPKWYVFANLIVATSGPAAYSNCGQLWITYDLQLISQFVPSAPAGTVPRPIIDSADFKHDDTVVVPSYTGRR